MATNAKLEFYRFKLNHKNEEFKTFRDYSVEQLKAGKNPSNEKVVEMCLKHFLNSLKGDFAKNDTIKKKISFEKKKSINKYFDKGPSFNSADHTIFGVISGGPYGRDRIVSNNDDEEDSSQLSANKAVLLYFFFYAYLPPDHNEGFYMIHSNSKDESITVLFRSYMSNLFNDGEYRKAIAEEFCPKSFQDEFKKGATLKSISFKTSFVDNVHTTSGTSENSQGYQIKIEAIPNNKNISSEHVAEFFKKMASKMFGSKDKEKRLSEFDQTKMVLESEISNSQKTFEWNHRENDFVPVVYLKGRLKKQNPDGTPDFDELKEYCSTIFRDEILPEIRPDLYVTKAK